jgi:hypothetical protein
MYLKFLLNRFFYGLLLDFSVTRFFACLSNYVLLFCFYQRCKHQSGVRTAAVLVLIATVIIYEVLPTAEGLSCIWSFMYGYLTVRDRIDHALFWIPTIGTIGPWALNVVTKQVYAFLLWPWHPDFVYIATAAHLSFALIGAICGAICGAIRRRV